ncbi:MAG: hypothetical protein ABR571_17155 [Jatrophihabitans sp.]|uniref:hypothetical protein n=1 Tax=Jatrophihabitans sp. TaxID=1932789 RepID=UPI0039103541
MSALWLLVASLFSAVAAPAAATALPTPTLISVSVTSNFVAPCAPPTCSAPPVLVAQNAAFNVTITLTGAGGAPAAFTKDTALSLVAPGPGSLSPSNVVMPRDTSSTSFLVAYSTAANGVTVSVAPGKGKTAIPSVGSNAFDVLQSLRIAPASANKPFQDGTGLKDCLSTDATDPICAQVVLSNGSNSNVVLSSGSCAGIGCNTKGTVSQIIADLGGLYTRSAPAEMIIHCYRTICGSGGVNKYQPLVSQSATGTLQPAPACPAKNTIGAGQTSCVDYVQSTRQGADNLLLFVLFLDDFRASL